MKNLQKCINEARDFANKNNKTGLIDFLKKCDCYKTLNKYDREHYLKKILKFFDEDIDFESILLLEELNGMNGL